MIRLDIHEAALDLARHLERLEAGEVIVLCERGVPIAEIRALPQPPTGPRRLGLGREELGDWELPETFFDPLPDEVLAAFEGDVP